jgi:hypothetical protein
MRRKRSRLKDLTREGRITVKEYLIFNGKKEMENESSPFVELKH